jgi:N-acetylmuramoyl-L-alanine amidase
MNVQELAQTKCPTAELAPLARQIADTLIASLTPADIIDISDHVTQVGGSTLPYLQRAAGDSLIAAINESGQKPQLVHALRTLPQQYMVYYQYRHHLCGIPLAAAPGTSPHEHGVAVDLQDHNAWIQVLARHGWVWRGSADPAHFNFHGAQNPDFGIKEIEAFQRTWNDHNPTDLIKIDGSYGPKTESKLVISPIAGW